MRRFVLVGAVLLSLGLASPAEAAKKIYVGGLAWGTPSEDLWAHVAPFGPVNSIRVASIDRNGELSARATIEFEHDRDADAAADALDGTTIGGRRVSAKSREIVVVGSKVKDVVRSAGLRSDGELVQAVSEKVHEILREAIKRAKANKRGTVRPYDL